MRFEDGAAIVRERSAGLCECCRKVGIQTHHRTPRGMGGVSGLGRAVNKPSNLLRLCLACHQDAESQREQAFELGRLVYRGDDPSQVPVWLQHVNGTGWWLLDDVGNMAWSDKEAPRVDPWPLGGPVGKKSSGPGTYSLL